MENKIRNEMEITLAGEKILLRPDFESIASLEMAVGSLAWISWKFTRGLTRQMPGMTDIAQVIYHTQAARDKDDITKKKFSLEEIWQMVMADSQAALIRTMIEFLARVTMGNKMQSEMSETQKKSSSETSQLEAM